MGTRYGRRLLPFRGVFLSGFAELVVGQLLGCRQRIVSLDGNIRSNAGAFPVLLRDRIDGPAFGNADHEVVVDAMAGYGVCAATGCLADKGGALLRLEVIAELLAAGEGAVGREHEDRLGGEPRTGEVREGPVLGRLVAFAIVEVVEVGGLFENVRGHHVHHLWIASAVVSHVEDKDRKSTRLN